MNEPAEHKYNGVSTQEGVSAAFFNCLSLVCLMEEVRFYLNQSTCQHWLRNGLGFTVLAKWHNKHIQPYSCRSTSQGSRSSSVKFAPIYKIDLRRQHSRDKVCKCLICYDGTSALKIFHYCPV